jgi:hypothetical protein
VPPDETFRVRGSSASTVSVEMSARSAPPITRSRFPLVAAVAPWRGLGSRSDEVAAFGGPGRACALEEAVEAVCVFDPPEKSPLAASTTSQPTNATRSTSRSRPRRRAPLICRRRLGLCLRAVGGVDTIGTIRESER